MLDRFQRYLDSFSRVPTDEEVADALRMSRRGFFGATAALAVAPYWIPAEDILLPGTGRTIQWYRYDIFSTNVVYEKWTASLSEPEEYVFDPRRARASI